METRTKKEIENYVKSTFALEDIYLTNDEWNELIKAIEENHDKSFIEEIVKKLGEKANGKTR